MEENDRLLRRNTSSAVALNEKDLQNKDKEEEMDIAPTCCLVYFCLEYFFQKNKKLYQANE